MAARTTFGSYLAKSLQHKKLKQMYRRGNRKRARRAANGSAVSATRNTSLLPLEASYSRRVVCDRVPVFAFRWKAGVDPVLFAALVIAHACVTHGRQFTGGVL